MDWTKLHQNVPYGFSGLLPPGTYLIGDIELLKLNEKMPDGIWQCDDSLNCLSVLRTGLGYFKVYHTNKLWKGAIEEKIAIISSDLALKVPDSAYSFQSTTPVHVRANELNGSIDIKFNNEHIIVTYEDPNSEDENVY
jgi:hypothetical protein